MGALSPILKFESPAEELLYVIKIIGCEMFISILLAIKYLFEIM